MALSRSLSLFAERFGGAPEAVARAPGRVNLMGEHTDYNDGFVLPIAIEQSTWAALRLREDDLVRAYSDNVGAEQTWMRGARADSLPHWATYIAGIADLLERRGARLRGFDLALVSDVPVGGGLSSSAALEVSVAKALIQACGEPMDARELADLCRAAEHEYAGVPCGIMDQYVSILGQADVALLLDCRARTWRHIPLELGPREIVVIDSGVRHELAAGEYARRRDECGAALAYFQRLNPRVRALRDVEPETVRAHASQMDPVAAARASHVTSENRRTLEFADALTARDWPKIGALMADSHRSLRDDYEVSSPELDRIVEVAQATPGVVGARMTGGGFGGCAVALVEKAARAAFEERLIAEGGVGGAFAGGLIPVRAGAGASLELG